MKNNTYVAIMAGGVGSRFWPASRAAKPKQFLDILGVGRSLLQLTYDRLTKLCPPENVLIVTNADYKALVQEQLPAITDNQVLCEPSRNNTAPCIAYAALKVHQLNPEANLVVAPSDHVILYEDAFISALGEALDYTSSHDALLTLGIEPTRPDTGYGYIHFERSAVSGRVHKVRKFTEKPPLDKAREFVASGDYLWNAGIFVWHCRSIIKAYKELAPDIHSILSGGNHVYNTPEEQAFINQHYPSTPNISVDFAIMEKADNVYSIPSSFGWSDLGTWASLYAELQKDDNNNVIQAHPALVSESTDNLIRVQNGKLAVIRGLNNYIVVDEPDALMIYPKDKEQEIKQVTEKIKKELGEAYL